MAAVVEEVAAEAVDSVAEGVEDEVVVAVEVEEAGKQ